MKERHLQVWFTVGFLILSACGTKNAGSPESPTAIPATPDVNTVESVFGPGTFSFAIPSGWDVLGPEKINPEPNRSYDLYLLGENPSTEEGPGTSRVIIANADEWSPEELAVLQCNTCPQNAFDSVTLSGKSALRTQIGGGGVPFMITWYFVENQGNLIAFALHDPITLLTLDDVIESIIFE